MGYKESTDDFADSKDFEVPAILSESLVLFPHMEIATVRERSGKSLRAARSDAGAANSRLHPRVHFPDGSGTIGTLAIVKKSSAEKNGRRSESGIEGDVEDPRKEIHRFELDTQRCCLNEQRKSPQEIPGRRASW